MFLLLEERNAVGQQFHVFLRALAGNALVREGAGDGHVLGLLVALVFVLVGGVPLLVLGVLHRARCLPCLNDFKQLQLPNLS